MLRIIVILAITLLPAVSAVAKSKLEDARDSALMVEEYLERLQVAVEDACTKGKMRREAWEQYCVIRWHVRSLLRVMTMAVLFYEEAPNEAHRELIATSAQSLAGVLLVLDNFCNAKGIEVPPPTLRRELTKCTQSLAAYNA
ncbi:MAG: hypothetical protein ACE5IC_08145 [Candidatus Brocadiales bacterium]